jgi:aspartate kinase
MAGGNARPVVVKFGGSSLDEPDAAVRYVQRLLRRGPLIVVVSARAGVTDHLERLLRSPRSLPRERRLERHLRRAHSIPRSPSPPDLARFRELLRPDGGELSSDAREKLLAEGERLAAEWFTQRLERAGTPAAPLDAAQIGLVVQGRRGERAIGLTASRTRVVAAVRRAWGQGRLPVVTGYFGRSRDGRVRVLGRGSSDYTATALAMLLEASRVELVKATPGILSADPELVPAARTLRKISYQTAQAAAAAGARVLHPRSIPIARRARIPVRIASLPRPGRGTWISGREGAKPRAILSLTREPSLGRNSGARRAGVPILRIVEVGDGGSRRTLVASLLAGRTVARVGPRVLSVELPVSGSEQIARRVHARLNR